jgi:ubiquinone/menaquinone biosynthesis C-methylase UbiE
VSGAYRPSLRDRYRVRARRALLERLRQAVVPEGTRLLDLGGGTGAATVVLGAGARELVVLEPNGRKVARGRAAGTPVTFVQASAEAIPFAGERFDRVVSLLSFHHFSRGDDALGEAARVLVPGGRLVVCDVDTSTSRGRWVARIEGRWLGHSVAFTTAADLERRALAAGFRSVRRATVGPWTLVVAER